MTSKERGPRPPTPERQRSTRPKKQGSAAPDTVGGGLTGKHALALWELVVTGDGKPRSKRRIKLDNGEMIGLESAGLVTIAKTRGKDPFRGSKLYLTEEGWAWANGPGIKARLSPTKAAVPVLGALLAKVGAYLELHGLALDDLLRPRAPEPRQDHASATVEAAPVEALEDRIRAAYLRVTGGALNEYVRLAELRTQLPGEPREDIDEELRRMQLAGGTVLYPMDDPQRRRPEDDAAALRVSGERRDLVCITR